MKFNNTYLLLEYLNKQKKKINISFREYMGAYLAEVDGDIDDSMQEYLKNRFEELADKIKDEFQGEPIQFDGTGNIIKNKKGELMLAFNVRNQALPNDCNDSSEEERFMYGLMSCLYECLASNSLLKNPPEDEDFEYDNEFDPIPIQIDFVIKKREIEKLDVKVLNFDEIIELSNSNKEMIVKSLYSFIKDENDGACSFWYSEGSDLDVSFDADNYDLTIFDIGKFDVLLKDYFIDGQEYEIKSY